jgi:archaemetzincin
MKLYYFLSLFSFLFLFSCKQKERKPLENAVIRIQPFTDMDSGEVNQLANEIRKLYPSAILSPAVKLPDFAFYVPRGRYKADSLLKFLSSLAKPNEIVLGLTVKDISTHNRSNSDWGVMGLGTCPGNSCVVSTFRLNMTKGKNQLFKVSIHELGHTFGLPHCPTLSCYMRDAKGGNPTDEEKDFCSECKRYLKRHFWRV